MINQLNRANANKGIDKVNLDSTQLKLKDFDSCDAEGLTLYVTESIDLATKRSSIQNPRVTFEVQSLADMTPMQFHQYIEEQKSSLKS